MFGQTVFGFNFITNADCKKRMLEIQQLTKLSNIQSPERDTCTYLISILGYNIIIWAVVGEIYNKYISSFV